LSSRFFTAQVGDNDKAASGRAVRPSCPNLVSTTPPRLVRPDGADVDERVVLRLVRVGELVRAARRRREAVAAGKIGLVRLAARRQRDRREAAPVPPMTSMWFLLLTKLVP
jgi:hypothetical protein